jgi:hypothetical protein
LPSPSGCGLSSASSPSCRLPSCCLVFSSSSSSCWLAQLRSRLAGTNKLIQSPLLSATS